MTSNVIDGRLIEALRNTGSGDYVIRSGPILELMTQLAKEGDLVPVSHAYLAYVNKVPADRKLVMNMVPAKILNQYIYLYRKGSTGPVQRWIDRTPDWADRIMSAVPDPSHFERLVTAMADDATQEGEQRQ